jgi:uncharacterized protein YneF (UPF0154 family)
LVLATELLSPHVWPALLVSLPVAVVTAVLALLAVPLLTATLFVGFPARVLVGVWVGFLVARRLGRRRTEENVKSAAA